MKWKERVRLGDLAKVLNGYAFKSKEYTSQGIRIIRITNVQKGCIKDDNPKYVPADRKGEFSRYMLESGDILISLTGNVGRVGVIDQELLPAVLNQRVGALKIKNESIVPAYLYQLLNSDNFERDAVKNSKGIAQLNLSSKWIEEYQIPLPPLSEQKRIAGILDAADRLRAKRREALAQLDTLLQSTFLDLFGDPVTNPKGLPKIAIGDVIKVKSGSGLAAKNMAEDGVYPVYGGNGINGYHDSYMFEDAQVVLGRVGVYCGAVHLTKPKSWITDNALYVSNYLKNIDVSYLLAALKNADLNKYAGRAAQPLISGGRIYPVEILDPPLSLQHRFAAIVEQVEAQKARMRTQLTELDTLFAALQQRAFNGEL